MRRALLPAGAALAVAVSGAVSGLAAHAAAPELVARYVAAGRTLTASQCQSQPCTQAAMNRVVPEKEKAAIGCFLDGLDRIEGAGAGARYIERLEALAREAEGRGEAPAPPTEQDIENWKASLAGCGVATERREG